MKATNKNSKIMSQEQHPTQLEHEQQAFADKMAGLEAMNPAYREGAVQGMAGEVDYHVWSREENIDRWSRGLYRDDIEPDDAIEGQASIDEQVELLEAARVRKEKFVQTYGDLIGGYLWHDDRKK